VVWIDLNPRTGHEQSGLRPAVVLSPVAYNRKVGLALLCPITSHKKGYPFEVELPKGLSVSGVILADQVKRWDWRVRGTRFACALPPDCTAAVLQRASLLLS
jgi:mRNA interferase MazF